MTTALLKDAAAWKIIAKPVPMGMPMLRDPPSRPVRPFSFSFLTLRTLRTTSVLSLPCFLFTPVSCSKATPVQHLDFSQELPFWKAPPPQRPLPSALHRGLLGPLGADPPGREPHWPQRLSFPVPLHLEELGVRGAQQGGRGWRSHALWERSQEKGFSSSLRMSESHREVPRMKEKSQDM